MDPWGIAAALAAGSVLVGTIAAVAMWLVRAGESLGQAKIEGLKLQLQAVEDQRDVARLALASELAARDARAQGARLDWDADRELREAAADPDPARKHERLSELLARAQAGAAAPGEPPDPDDEG